MQCVILAGGLGTRLRALDTQRPKALLPIKERPFIDYQLEHLAHTGITDVVLCLGHKGDQIRAYVLEGQRWNLKVQYVDEGDKLQGTGGAVRLAYDAGTLNEEFFVLYGDSFLPIDFSVVWRYSRTRREPAVMTVIRNENQWDRSNACFENNKVTLYDKNPAPEMAARLQYIDYGLSFFRRERVRAELPSGYSDLSVLFNKLSLHGELAGYEIHERFYEIGSLSGVADFTAYIESRRV